MPAVPFIQPLAYYPPASGSRPFTTRYPRSLSAARKFAQGAGSALLVFAGADSMTDNAAAAAAGAPPMVDFSSLDAIVRTVLTGGLTGPLQIIAAAFLFLAAGRCVARFFGLVVAAGILLLYLQGVTFEDAWLFVQRFALRLSAAVSAFETADVG